VANRAGTTIVLTPLPKIPEITFRNTGVGDAGPPLLQSRSPMPQPNVLVRSSTPFQLPRILPTPTFVVLILATAQRVLVEQSVVSALASRIACRSEPRVQRGGPYWREKGCQTFRSRRQHRELP